MITPKERLKCVLKGEKVDRPPCICPGGMMNMVIEEVMDLTGSHWPKAHTDPQLMAKLTQGIYENGAFENFGVPFCMTVEAEAMGAPVFLGTKVNEPRVIAYPIDSVTQWRKLRNIDVTKGRIKVTLDAIKILKDRDPSVPVVANLTGPVSLASSLMEPINYYKELRKKPREAHEMMAYVTENLIAFGKAQLEAGANVLTISDPSGTGEILGPKMFREFVVPYLNKIIDALKHLAEVGTIIHICGRLKSIYKELNCLSSDAISFDSITSVKQVAENVKGKVIMGNVSTFALENSDADHIKTTVKNCMKNGAEILSPACGIGPRTSLKNIRAMVQAVKECEDKSFQL
ncbi:methylcobamide:CoM methyltransferase MtbA [Marinisporobacter balticus]|uniref:[methyl-Co(III) methanol-specific corrinoid protein]:coenzyme M methyltransferase n=1 Tax=Marinisporobacter balticus TaxID=2018667 RepID=A0A4R2KGG8_9FIRM|nr:methylcobamide:CoM methyltransferase MtbA [Marinisporobacter balticus]TCO72693.1 [methyl-Co(III) methanol-specific corrinoid protein]:coenzyme M methyltransferase [Marinisporobacter balticus]